MLNAAKTRGLEKEMVFRRLESVPASGTIDGEADIGTDKGQAKEDKLEEEPTPSSSLLLRLCPRAALVLVLVLAKLLLRRIAARLAGAVQVLGFHLDDVVIIRKLSSLSRETEIGDGRELDV